VSLKVKTTCPLGSECEKIVDGEIHRCAWYVELQGTNPQDGTPINESKCAMAWQPLLMIEGNGAQRGITQSILSLREETIKRQETAIGVINGIKSIKSQ
jgi:hypothetical protein